MSDDLGSDNVSRETENIVEETILEPVDDPKPWLFKPGNKLGGRPKGSRNKLGEDFISALQQDFRSHGDEVIARVREDKPDQYLKVIASILPKEFTVNHNAGDELSDDQLGIILDAARRRLAQASEHLGADTDREAEQEQATEPVPVARSTET